MRKEIDKAVETFHRIAFGTGKNGRRTVNENQLASFITVLTELLLLRYKDIWYPESPNRGSGYRCLRINSQCMDPTIVDSLIKSEISVRPDFRNMELTIWVDPGVVSIRIGEDGSIGTEEVEMDPPVSRKDSTSEDEAYSSRSPSPISESSTPTKGPSPTPSSSSAHITPKIHQGSSVFHESVSPSSSIASSPASISCRSPVTPVYHHHHRISSPSQNASPSGSRVPSPQYSRPKVLFPPQDSSPSLQSFCKEGMMAVHQTHHALSMRMAHRVGLPQPNYMDIPAQA